MTVADLGLAVHSKGLRESIDQLKQLPPAARGAEEAANRLSTGSTRAITRMEQSIVRANARIRGSIGQLSADFKGMTSMFTVGLASSLAAGFSATAAKQLLDGATRIKNALKVAGLAGDDLAKVYDHLYASAQKNGAPLEALATLYGRAAQQQKELGVSTEQLLKFTDDVSLALRVAGTDAAQASGALLQLGQALGSGTVHAEEFNSVLEGVPTIAQAAAAGIKEANGSVAKLKQLVVDGKLSSRAFFDGFAAGSETLAERARNSETTISAGFVRLQNILVDVAKRFDDSTHASRTLAHMIDTTLIPAIQELGGIFSSVANGPIGQFYDWLGKTIDRVVQLSADLGAITGLDKIGGNPYIGPGRIQDRIDAAFSGTSYSTPKNVRKPTEVTVNNGSVAKPITLADYPVTGDSKKGGRAVKKTAWDAVNENLTAIQNRTKALEEEREALGLSFEEQIRRKTALELEQQALKDVQEAARRKGDTDWQNVRLSKDQKAAIDEVSDAYAKQADALRQAQDAQEFRADVLQAGFDGVRNALEDGKITLKEWGDIGISVLDKLIDRIENQLVDALSKASAAGSSGGGGGGLFGLIGQGISWLFGGGGGSYGTYGAGVTGDPWAGLRLAGGGPVRGPGSATSDSIHARLSNGEYVVNAAATSRNRSLLDAINNGIPGFAAGGLVPGGEGDSGELILAVAQ